MILQRHSHTVSRRSAFTLLEVLVVVAIILVLASVATVSVMQVLRDSKGDAARMNCVSLNTALKAYMLRNEGNPPDDINGLLPYVEGNDPAKLTDPWNKSYMIGKEPDPSGHDKYFIYTTNDDKGGEMIRSDTKK